MNFGHMQCQRDSRCSKPNGHKGWCATKGGGAKAQDDLLAARGGGADEAMAPGRRSGRSAAGAASARISGMAELAAKRERRQRGDPFVVDDDDVGSDGDAEPEEEEYVDDDDEQGGGVQYEDFGVSAAERRELGRGGRGGRSGDVVDVSGGDDGWAAGGPPAPLEALERIRVPRAKLEEWLNEPFFERTVRGCVVRLAMGECGVGPGAPALYRVAVVAAVDERGEEYTLGSDPGQPTRKGLLLDFGECKRRYEMKLVSNQPFDRTELDAYAHVCAAAGAAPPSRAQVDAKLGHLQRASNYSYTEEEVRAKVQQQAQREGAVLTTRQKLAMQAAQAAGTARPKKMMRNVLGQAIVQDYD